MPFYENPAFRRRVLETCTNPAAVSFFTQIAHKTSGEADSPTWPVHHEQAEPVRGSDFVRPIIGQARSTIDFRACMDAARSC